MKKEILDNKPNGKHNRRNSGNVPKHLNEVPIATSSKKTNIFPKTKEEQNLQRLREEFNEKQKKDPNHPKTSYSNNRKIGTNQHFSYTKSLSADKYKQKAMHNSYNSNFKNINNTKSNHNHKKKQKLDYCDKRHPGYLYYKESQNLLKKYGKRTQTGKIFNRKINLDPVGFHKNNNGRKFPDIYKSQFRKMSSRPPYFYNNPINKNNPFSPYWINKILNKNDFQIEIKGFANGVPQLKGVRKNNNELMEILSASKEIKDFNKQQNEIKNSNNNNYCKIFDKENNDDKYEMRHINGTNDNNKKENDGGGENVDEDNNINDDDMINENEKPFYTNQKNFFKFRKDIMEEPEYLEQDDENNENNENNDNNNKSKKEEVNEEIENSQDVVFNNK